MGSSNQDDPLPKEVYSRWADWLLGSSESLWAQEPPDQQWPDSSKEEDLEMRLPAELLSDINNATAELPPTMPPPLLPPPPLQQQQQQQQPVQLPAHHQPLMPPGPRPLETGGHPDRRERTTSTSSAATRALRLSQIPPLMPQPPPNAARHQPHQRPASSSSVGATAAPVRQPRRRQNRQATPPAAVANAGVAASVAGVSAASAPVSAAANCGHSATAGAANSAPAEEMPPPPPPPPAPSAPTPVGPDSSRKPTYSDIIKKQKAAAAAAAAAAATAAASSSAGSAAGSQAASSPSHQRAAAGDSPVRTQAAAAPAAPGKREASAAAGPAAVRNAGHPAGVNSGTAAAQPSGTAATPAAPSSSDSTNSTSVTGRRGNRQTSAGRPASHPAPQATKSQHHHAVQPPGPNHHHQQQQQQQKLADGAQQRSASIDLSQPSPLPAQPLSGSSEDRRQQQLLNNAKPLPPGHCGGGSAPATAGFINNLHRGSCDSSSLDDSAGSGSGVGGSRQALAGRPNSASGKSGAAASAARRRQTAGGASSASTGRSGGASGGSSASGSGGGGSGLVEGASLLLVAFFQLLLCCVRSLAAAAVGLALSCLAWCRQHRQQRRRRRRPAWLPAGLQANVELPLTAEDTVRRLLACQDHRDAYSVLGVRRDAEQREIVQHYRHQLRLLQAAPAATSPGVHEAAQLLQRAFALLDGHANRREFDSGAAGGHADMAQLAADLQLAVHRLPCARCSGRHLWLPTDLSPQAARYCSACRVRHPAQDGDLWAESRLLGLRRVFLACQDGRVCQVNELARCQAELFAKLQPDCHRCQLRRAEAAPPYRFVYRK